MLSNFPRLALGGSVDFVFFLVGEVSTLEGLCGVCKVGEWTSFMLDVVLSLTVAKPLYIQQGLLPCHHVGDIPGILSPVMADVGVYTPLPLGDGFTPRTWRPLRFSVVIGGTGTARLLRSPVQSCQYWGNRYNDVTFLWLL